MRHDCLYHLTQSGINLDDALALRRIAMTLHRWHEMECNGDIEQGEVSKKWYQCWTDAQGHRRQSDSPIADRERGALKRLAEIMARYPDYAAYVQGDPRGASLYILHPNALAGADWFSTDASKRDAWLSTNYSRGIAVYK